MRWPVGIREPPNTIQGLAHSIHIQQRRDVMLIRDA